MESVVLLVFPVASTGYLVRATLLDFEGTFVGDPRHGRVGRGIRSEDGPELKDKLRSICGLIMEAVG